MKKLAVMAIVVVVAGLVGYAVLGAREHKGSLAAEAVAAAVDSSRSAPAVSTPATGSDIARSAGAASKPAGAQAPTTRPADARQAENATTAMRQAADAKKHLFVFVHEKDDEQTREGRKTFDAAVRKLGDAVQWIAVNRSAPSETEFVGKYGLKAAPMPVVIAFAPNGAIVGGFLGARLTEQQLTNALASPVMQTCLKALQERKLVFLCAQNGATKSNEAAMKGVNEFKGDARFAQFTEIVRVDPADAAEKKFLRQLQIDSKVDQAATIFLAPPGAIIGKLSGATDKNKLIAMLQAASSGCGAGGCGPSGCAPKK